MAADWLEAIVPEVATRVDEALAELGPAALPGDQLIAALGDRLGSAAGWDPELRWTELILAIGCVAGHRAALERFEREIVDKLVPALAARGAGAAEIDELLQEVRAQLLVADGKPPGLASYSGRGSLRAFVRSAAIRAWLNRRRSEARRTAREAVADILSSDRFTSPELEHMKALYLEHYQRALRDAWSTLDGEQQLLLRNHLIDRMSIDQLAKLYGIHRSSAARRIAAARDALIATSKRLLARDQGLSRSGVDSVLRLIRSRLEIDIDDL